jgi:hypothetical protein
MPTYEFWYDETYAYKATFTADNGEEAGKLYEAVQDGSLAPMDIPNVFVKDKSYELLADELTEIGDN